MADETGFLARVRLFACPDNGGVVTIDRRRGETFVTSDHAVSADG